jgi:hypothetical protein
MSLLNLSPKEVQVSQNINKLTLALLPSGDSRYEEELKAELALSV